MSFLIAVLLFVVGVGVLDARLPWPRTHSRPEDDR
jgi:hypothetical protein